MQVHSHSAQELQQWAGDFVSSAPLSAGATVVTLSGELGAGKTTFVQGVARALGVEGVVSSPTFVIEKIYALSGQRWSHLVHIDAYRLNNPKEIEVLGWNELLQSPTNLIILEWPERIESYIPKSAVRLKIDIEGDGRIITQYGGEKAE